MATSENQKMRMTILDVPHRMTLQHHNWAYSSLAFLVKMNGSVFETEKWHGNLRLSKTIPTALGIVNVERVFQGTASQTRKRVSFPQKSRAPHQWPGSAPVLVN